MNPSALLFRYRAAMLLFIGGLVISGVTAFPLLWELRMLANLLGVGEASGPEGHTGLSFWILTVRNGLVDTDVRYPWIAYGTDWLAFGHLIIAMFFVGPLLHPLSGKATIYTGIVACIAVIPLALICGPIRGPIRGIPLSWRLVDCSFGVLGVIPLVYCLRLIGNMEVTAIKSCRGR